MTNSDDIIRNQKSSNGYAHNGTNQSNNTEICILSSFTIEPIEEILRLALNENDIKANITFAPTGQLNQQLISPVSSLNKNGCNLFVLRIQDLYKLDIEEIDAEANLAKSIDSYTYKTKIKENIEELIANIEFYAANNESINIIAVAPPSKQLLNQFGEQIYLDLTHEMSLQISSDSTIRLLAFNDFEQFPTEEYHDHTRYTLGKIPYKPFYFDFMANVLTKLLRSQIVCPAKVIVVDADNTLWTGVCGEQSLSDIHIGNDTQLIQAFLLQQKSNGMLICIASKNHEDDVKHLFNEHKGMLLKWDDLVLTRINWVPKSINIQSLSKELNLSLDSFIFIDDNPVECAEVRSRLPEVVTVLLPQKSQSVEQFLKRISSFCARKSTSEDGRRNELYQENKLRERERSRFTSMNEYIENLNIKIEFSDIDSSNLSRVAQMTSRTNQFNLFKKPRNAEQIIGLLSQPETFGVVANVSDRFGDYGITALAIYQILDETCVVDTFLLSCRVLGRGVEYALIEKIGQIASKMDVKKILFPTLRTIKNKPALDFISRVSTSSLDNQENKIVFEISVEQILSIRFNADEIYNEISNNKSQENLSVNTHASFLESEASKKVERKEVLAEQLSAKNQLIDYLKLLVVDVCKVDAHNLADNLSYDEMGINSFFIIELTVKLEELFAQLSPTILSRYITLNDLSDYLIQSYQQEVFEVLKSVNRSSYQVPLENNNTYLDGDFERAERTGNNRVVSFAQKAMWTMHELEQALLSHMIPLTITIREQVNIGALEQSFKSLIKRHESLRSQFIPEDNGVKLYINEDAMFSLDSVDLTNISVEDREETIKKIKFREVNSPFDLTSELPIRVKILTLRDSRHILLITLHHLVSDGWSLRILFNDLATFYHAYLNGIEDVNLATLRRDYADYAEKESSSYTNGDFDMQACYWRDTLETAPLLLNLPVDYARPAYQTYKTSVQHFSLSELESNDVRSLSKEFGTSLYATLLSVYSILLSQYCRQDDLVIGTPISNRKDIEFNQVIGYFVNVVPQRIRINSNHTFRDLLLAVAKSSKLAMDNSELHFSKIVETLDIQRDARYSPLVQVLFALQNTPAENKRFLNSDFSLLETERAESLFDLTLEIDDTGNEIKGRIEYNAALFKKEKIVQMIEYFISLVRIVTEEPERKIFELASIRKNAVEKYKSWSETRSLSSNEETVHGLLEKLANINVEQQGLIVKREDDSLLNYSYEEINHLANQTARYLISEGIKPKTRVALLSDLAIEMVITSLAIIKIGGVVMPVDAATSEFKLAYLLDITDSSFVISQTNKQHDHELVKKLSSSAQIVSELRENHESTLRWVTLDSRKISTESCVEDLQYDIQSTAPALVLFNNIDMGGQQGSCYTHKALVELFKRSTEDFELLCSLLGLNDFANAKFLLQALRAIVHHEDNSLPEISIKRTGESISLEGSYSTSSARISNVEYYVLDSRLRIVRPGIQGELYLSGTVIPNSICTHSEISDRNLIKNEYSELPNDSLYRTGKLCRYQNDENNDLINIEDIVSIEHVSSASKYRIPFREIELLVESNSYIERSLIVIKEIHSKTTPVCYFQTANGFEKEQTNLVNELYNLIKSKLLFIPPIFVQIESFPLTLDNKVDRQKLPLPQKFAGSSASYQAPKSTIEKELVIIWQEKLGIDKIGVNDNYFVLGGDSIRSISLVTEANKKGLQFSTKDLFVYPTIASLAEIIENKDAEVVEEYREIEPFELLSTEERSSLREHSCEDSLDDAYPLSMMQQGMVHLSIKQRHLNAYQNMHIYRFKTPWDQSVFEKALNILIRKHPMLRTVYYLGTQKPIQLVLKEKNAELNIVDCSKQSEASFDNIITQWIKEEHATGLDMSKSLWRLTIHILNDNEFLFSMFIHHAQWDGWSLESFATELYSTFAKLKSNKYVENEEKIPSYNQFIAAEQKAISSTEQQNYWRSKLEGVNLPWWAGKEKSPSVTVECEVSLETSKKLTTLAEHTAVQEKSLWCSIYLALLSILEGNNEITGPVITQGRPEIPGGDRIVGVFLNALILRASITDKSWKDFVKSTDYELREQHGYRHYPLAEMQRISGLDFSASVFTYTNWHVYYQEDNQNDTSKVDGYDLHNSLPIDGSIVPQKIGVAQATNYLLSVYVSKDEKTKQFSMSFTADAGVFDKEFRDRIQDYLTNIIDDLICNFESNISRERLLSREERNQLILELNSTQRDFNTNLCVHHLFEKRVELQPEAIAVEFMHSDSSLCQLTYAELNARSNQLAHYLIKQGVGPEVQVGICVERSVEMIVGILGILKAGGCYVPMDPQYPPARLEYILNKSKCRIILSEKHLLADLTFLNTVKTLPLDQEIQELILSKYSKENISDDLASVVSDNLAYVIYTSGSTGEPKGVSITHRNLNNLAYFQAKQYEFSCHSRILQFASLSFDAATWDWSMALLSGGVLRLVSEEVIKSPEQLNQIVKDQSITYSFLPPALLSLLDLPKFEGVKTLTVGGESPSIEMLKLWSSKRKLFNAYGPTENTVVSTSSLVPNSVDKLLIGKPIENVICYVFNPNKELVPMKVVGELYLGGEGLSRGYFSQPSLTAERFVPDPYSNTPGKRLYKTGDLVRHLPSTEDTVGGLEFVGRIDHQVKIRGYRIELGEIENVLLEHDAVKEVVVVAREDQFGSKYLAAYVVKSEHVEKTIQCQNVNELESDLDIDIALVYELRTLAQTHLPSYMVPTSIVVLKSFPLTPIGKIDLKGLPEPDLSFRQEYVQPEGEFEQQLSELWCSVLKCERVSRYDNFFDMGGHSLLVTQLLSRIREDFIIEITMRELFEQQTLREQAQIVEKAKIRQKEENMKYDDRILKVKENRQSLDEYEGALEEGEF